MLQTEAYFPDDQIVRSANLGFGQTSHAKGSCFPPAVPSSQLGHVHIETARVITRMVSSTEPGFETRRSPKDTYHISRRVVDSIQTI